MPDGDTIQLGIGGIPDAVVTFLKDKKDLGLHTEMAADGIIDLIETGVINNKKKTLHRGKSIATFAAGTQRLYDFLDNNPCIVPFIDHGAVVTTPRTEIDYVVTEYGIAKLWGRSLKERARELISIAHPDFRPMLAEEYEKRFGRPLD